MTPELTHRLLIYKGKADKNELINNHGQGENQDGVWLQPTSISDSRTIVKNQINVIVDQIPKPLYLEEPCPDLHDMKLVTMFKKLKQEVLSEQFGICDVPLPSIDQTTLPKASLPHDDQSLDNQKNKKLKSRIAKPIILKEEPRGIETNTDFHAFRTRIKMNKLKSHKKKS